MFSGSEPACVCYLHRCRPLVHRSEQDHQLVVDGQVAEDVALRHRDVPPQDLQDVVHRHWLVLIKLQTKRSEVRGNFFWFFFVSWHARWNKVFLSRFWKTTHKLHLEVDWMTFVSVSYKKGQSDFFATGGANRCNASFWRLLRFCHN